MAEAQRSGAESPSPPARVLTVGERSALPDLDDVAVGIANVAANLAVLGYWLCDELGSSTFPQFIARLNIRNAEIHKAVDVIRVGDAERYRRLIRGRPAPNVQNHPDIRKLKVPRRVAVTQAHNASAEDLLVVASRSLDVGDGEKMCDADPLSRGHLIDLLLDLYAAHLTTPIPISYIWRASPGRPGMDDAQLIDNPAEWPFLTCPVHRRYGRSVNSSSRQNLENVSPNRIPASHAAGDLWRLLLDPGGIDDEFERVRVLVLLHQLEIDKPFGPLLTS